MVVETNVWNKFVTETEELNTICRFEQKIPGRQPNGNKSFSGFDLILNNLMVLLLDLDFFVSPV